MPPTIYDRFRSGSFIWWLIALVVAVGLFRLRSWYLGGASTPDSLWRGYTPTDVANFLEHIGPGGRSLYAWTQLTLDAVFPIVYAVCVSRLLARTATPRIGRHVMWLPFVAAGLDYGENLSTAYLAWTFDGHPSSLASLANLFTRGKFIVLGLSLIVLAIAWLHGERGRLP